MSPKAQSKATAGKIGIVDLLSGISSIPIKYIGRGSTFGHSTDGELAHHPAVFMFEDMAVIHEGGVGRRRLVEADQ